MNTPELTIPTLQSIQVGLPQQIEEVDENGSHIWRTAYVKTAISGRIWLGSTNLVGDGQADKKHHGGPDQALLAYSADHYAAWQRELGLAMPPGAFGENFTITGQTEDSVCIGDIFDIGPTRVQITQPRQPCANIARRWSNNQLVKQVENTGRTGWYLRVLQEGYVESGIPVILVARPNPQWTITITAQAMRQRNRRPAPALALYALPELGSRIRATLADLAARHNARARA